MRRLALAVAFLLSAAIFPARAAVVAGGTGIEHFTDPGGGLPWGHVASNGVYLGNYGGNYWAITATHVGAGDMTLGGVSYNLVPGSTIRVLNNDNSNTDLTLFRIASDPGLGTLALATSAPVTNDVVVFVGDGGIEANGGTQRYWAVSGSGAGTTWNELPNSTGATHSGYGVGGGAGMRWGNAIVAGTDSFNVGTGATNAFVTEFVSVAGSTQGASGDSGGAAFFNDGGTWYLAGILGAIGTFTNQPGSTAVFGNVTYASDLADYRGFILSSIPEPAETGAIMAGAAALVILLVRAARKNSARPAPAAR